MPHTKAAFSVVESMIPTIRASQPKSLLYIGWRHDASPWWYDIFCKHLGVERVAVLEIYQPNFSDFSAAVKTGRYVAKPILGDARKLSEIVGKGEYDVIFWDHGPEHVSFDDLQKATPMLHEMAGKLLLYACPWGEWKQEAEGGNLDEEHKNYVTVDQLVGLGMTVQTTGESGQEKEGEIISFLWK